MKKSISLLALILVLLTMLLPSFAEEVLPVTAIPSVLKRDTRLIGKNPDGSFPGNPAVPGFSPTTGLPAGSDLYVPILVQIDNNIGALPQWGLASADIMYELPIAGSGLTRLTAFFADKHPQEAGPVRSARVMHADVREEWDALLVHYGEQTAAGSNFRQAIRDYGVTSKGLEIDGIGNKYAAQFPRVMYHRAPHNVSVQVRFFYDLMVQSGYKFPLRPFKFGDGADNGGVSAMKIEIIHKKNLTTSSTFLYDMNTKSYLRFTQKGLYTDLLAPEAQLSYSNIIVQRTKLDFNRHSSNPILPDVVGTGAADIFIGGKYIAGAWARYSAQTRTVFFDEKGNEITLQPGRTWIVMTDENTALTYESEYSADTQAYYAATGSFPTHKPLMLNDRGDEVRALKQRLFELGYFRTNKFNNQYQESTADAVRKYETDVGLTPDGIADSLTLAVMYGDIVMSGMTGKWELPKADPAFLVNSDGEPTPEGSLATEVPAATPAPIPPTEEPDAILAPKETGTVMPEVTPASEAEPTAEGTETPLETKGDQPMGEEQPLSEEGTETPVMALIRTGNNGTLNMRREASKDSRLVTRIPNGSLVQITEAGDTWTKVVFEGLEGYVMSEYLDSNVSEVTALQDFTPLTIGDAGPEVTRLKQRFYELGYFRGTSFNDQFIKSTADTVMRFERRNGLKADGIADEEMQRLLYSPQAKRP